MEDDGGETTANGRPGLWVRLDVSEWEGALFLDDGADVQAAYWLWTALLGLAPKYDGDIPCPRPALDLPRLCHLLREWPKKKVEAAVDHLANPTKRMPHLVGEHAAPLITLRDGLIIVNDYEERDPWAPDRLRKRRARAAARADLDRIWQGARK